MSTRVEDMLAAGALSGSELFYVVQSADDRKVALSALAEWLAVGGTTPISINYRFSDTITDADPGNGILRLDNVTQLSTTTIRADLQDVLAVNVTALLNEFDDSTNLTGKGYIRLQNTRDPTKWIAFKVTGLASPSGYKNISVTVVAGSGADPFINADYVTLSFVRTGDKGTDGAGGGGDVSSNTTTSVTNDFPQFADASGKLLKDGGISPDADAALAADSDLRLPTQKAVRAYVTSTLASLGDAMIFKGVIDCSANPNYPAADRGWTYKVSVAGKIGGASGPNVEVGDALICITDGTASGTHASVGSNWVILQANIDGAVIGPASATNNDFAQFDGTTGKLIKDAGLSLDTDAALTANSDLRIPSQKAVKAYVAAAGGGGGGGGSGGGKGVIGATWYNGGDPLATGKAAGFFTCPYGGTIAAWSIVVDAGTCTVKVWRIATGTAKPTSANSINTSGVAIPSGTAIRSTTLTDFTSTAIAANDIFAFSLEAVTGSPTEVTFELEITKADGTSVSGSFVLDETPNGAINGINDDYTTDFNFAVLWVYVNGQRMREGADYTVTGPSAFSMVTPLLTGDSLAVDYIKS